MQPHQPSLGRSEALLAAVVVALVAVLVWSTVFGGWMADPIRGVLRSVPASDKIGHFVIYGSITFFAALIAKRADRVRSVASFVMLVSIADEIRQLGEFNRSYSLGDLVANALGVIAGVALAKAVLRWRTSRSIDAHNERTPVLQ